MLSTLQASWSYTLAKSLLGTAEQADDLLANIEWKIANDPEGFPVVALPGKRLAATSLRQRGQKVRIGIFFRQLDPANIELQDLCLVEEEPSQITFFKLPSPLPLAA